MKSTQFLAELSNDKLGDYKKVAGADATAADKAGNFKRGNKRMSGITNATKKEFANDAAKAAADAEAKAKKVKETYSARGIMITETRTYKLWENAGRKLMEAELSQDQIQQIFQHVQSIETAGGGNRTMIGKGKDAVSAINQAWEQLKTDAQNSKPIAGFEAKYDEVAEKLKQATGGDQGAMKYVQMYRDFAKKHPVAQGVIYAAAIAALGISGAGLGGAAALGLFKMTDKLLQGEKFTSAAYSGAKTGALAYGASHLAQQFRDGGNSGPHPRNMPEPQGPDIPAANPHQLDPSQFQPNPNDFTPGSEDIIKTVTKGDTLSDIAEKYKTSVEILKRANPQITNPDALAIGTQVHIPPVNAPTYLHGVGTAADTAAKTASGAYDSVPKALAKQVAGTRGAWTESVNLSESQIYLVIGKIVERQKRIDEGMWDSIKGAAGDFSKWAQTKGTNLTTKITADKLLQAWKKAGSPTDSLDVASIIQRSGVASDTIKQIYNNMKIPFAGEPGAGTSAQRKIDIDPSSRAPVSTTAGNTAAPSNTSGASTAPGNTTAIGSTSGSTSALGTASGNTTTLGSTLNVGQIVKIIPTLRKRDLLSVNKTVDAALASKKKRRKDPNLKVAAESLGLNYPGTYEQTNDMFKGKGQRRTGTLTTEQNYDIGDYYNDRAGNDYGKSNYKVDTGASDFEKERIRNEPGGETGRPKSLAGASKSLPSDAFGRTTGRIPKGKTGHVHKVDMDEENQRIDPKCWTGYKKQGTKMKGDTRVNNCVPIKESAILKGLRG